VPGAAAADAPVRVDGHDAWLLRQLNGDAFAALVFDGPQADDAVCAARSAGEGLVPMQVLLVARAGRTPVDGARALVDAQGLVAQRYDGQPGTAYLLRPDQHVCARWRWPTREAFDTALRRALALK
jgi:3-(3-hydroxy-phenyl)propionate hydroxylase